MPTAPGLVQSPPPTMGRLVGVGIDKAARASRTPLVRHSLNVERRTVTPSRPHPAIEGIRLPLSHHRLITGICDQIQASLAPRYRAVITPYSAFESIEVAPIRRIVPDGALVERDPIGLSSGKE